MINDSLRISDVVMHANLLQADLDVTSVFIVIPSSPIWLQRVMQELQQSVFHTSPYGTE